MIVAIDHISFEATLEREYSPIETLSAVSQGSFQILSNTNVFIDWGAQPHVTEYLEDGTLVFHASVAGGGPSYRAFKQPWVGKPLDPPALWTYAHTKQSQTVFYVSWNGATEIYTWNFYIRAGLDRSESFVFVGTKNKEGFEMNFTIPEYCGSAFAEAVAANGTSLYNSSIVSTWIPGPELSALCDDWNCPEGEVPAPNNFQLEGERWHTPEEWKGLMEKLERQQLLQSPMTTGS